jgi:hypothetical protein
MMNACKVFNECMENCQIIIGFNFSCIAFEITLFTCKDIPLQLEIGSTIRKTLP